MFLRSVLPSFVADAIWPDHRTTYKLHPTSYLDGLRGIAAIIVCICHYTENNHGALTNPYGVNGPSSWIQLPFLRILFSGRPMVHIFFVISGFVLSVKPIKAIHAHDPEKVFVALSSSAFRRPIRLFGPCIASTFLIMVATQCGYMYTPAPTFAEQFWNWKDVAFHQITWPWSWDKDLRPGYDIHLWTIPIEYVHSMLLFMIILLLSRVRHVVRLSAVVGLILYFLSCGKWAAFEFTAGLFLAECHVIRGPHAKIWESSEILASYPPPKPWLGRVGWTILHISIVATWLFIGGWPNMDGNITPGIRWFLAATPEPFASMDWLHPQKFWFGLSAAFAVWSIGELRPLRKLLEGPVPQYYGRISYAVYIMHGPVLDNTQRYVLGHPFLPAQGEFDTAEYIQARPATGVRMFVGDETPVQRTVGWFMGLCLLGPLVIWAADVFWRWVDNPIIALGRRVEMACLDDASEDYRPRQGFALAA
jgi:peptidoglycan/LPS O-acetylase OafA/YrhL